MTQDMVTALAATDLANLLKPKVVGERVNSHVVQAVREPAPDFEAMRRLVSAPSSVSTEKHAKRHDSATAPKERSR